jgi:hypothetical protein
MPADVGEIAAEPVLCQRPGQPPFAATFVCQRIGCTSATTCPRHERALPAPGKSAYFCRSSYYRVGTAVCDVLRNAHVAAELRSGPGAEARRSCRTRTAIVCTTVGVGLGVITDHMDVHGLAVHDGDRAAAGGRLVRNDVPEDLAEDVQHHLT